MGKTEKGAVWLDPEKTSPYEFFQYWRNVGDTEVIKCLKMLTFVPIEEIEEMEKWEGSELNKAKEILAYELTKLVHGDEEADKALNTSRSLFASKTNSEDMPTSKITSADLTDGKIGLIDLLFLVKLVPSKAEARRLIKQNGIAVDDVKVTDEKAEITADRFTENGYIVIKKGKKVFHKVSYNG